MLRTQLQEADHTMRTTQPPPAIARIGGLDAHRLELLVPVTGTLEERTLMTLRCRDADSIPKVARAGEVIEEADGTRVQIMHNGVKVLAGGYYGDWMQDLIARGRGHHEPQEELIFAEVVRHLPTNGVMFELGGYWSYYSIWFLSQSGARRSYIIEPDPAHLEIGRTNARLNGCQPVFIHAYVGPQSLAPEPFTTESSGIVELSCVSVTSLMATYGIDHLDMLHCDAQGIETGVLESCAELFSAGRVSWVFVSTHTHHISGDPLTHQRCLSLLLKAGATIVAEHDVQESFSGDGLIVAKFGALPDGWVPPVLSYNRYCDSLFRNPLYDLAAASQAPQPAAADATSPSIPPPISVLEASRSFALAGGMLTMTADCSLGSAGETLLLPFDEVMFPTTIAQCGWQIEELGFLEQHIDAGTRYAVLDIGANIGLFTRQVSRRFPNTEHFYCVEPDPGNFRALRYNLGGLPERRHSTWNVALSTSDAEQKFFRDTTNFGNYSLNSDAMRGRQFRTIKVRSVATDAWMNQNIILDPDIRLIWKSDTQGYDELIISLTPMAIWERVDFAIVELWRIDKPDFDITQFRIRLESFPNLSIGLGNSHSVPEVIKFLSGSDWVHEDLYLWR